MRGPETTVWSREVSLRVHNCRGVNAKRRFGRPKCRLASTDAPAGTRSFSGKISLRISPEAHRRIAMEAAAEGVSINQLIASRI